MNDDGDYTVQDPLPDALAALARLMPALVSRSQHQTDDDFSFATSAHDMDGEDNADESGDAEEFEYKLFSSAQPTKVTIAEPVEADYATPSRPISYYLHTPIDSDILQRVVVTGDQVRAESRVPWAKTGRLVVVPLESAEKRKRWRPSLARRRKFKIMKREAEEREQKRLALRSVGRNRGRGGKTMDRVQGGPRGGIGHGTAVPGKGVKEQGIKKPSGYPRKGAPPV